MVLNGWEIGGGSVRIHREEVQSKVFRALKIGAEEAQAQVRLPARRAAVRRAAARRHRLRPRPHRDADGRRRVDPRRDRLPEDAARAGPADQRAAAGRREAAARAAHPAAQPTGKPAALNAAERAASRRASAACKIPESVLVVIHTPALEVLLIERADQPGFWQSRHRQQGRAGRAAARDLPCARCSRRPGIDDGRPHPRCATGSCRTSTRSIRHWRHRYAPGVTHNTEHVFGLRAAAPACRSRSRRASTCATSGCPGARRRRRCFSWSNVQAIEEVARRRLAGCGSTASAEPAPACLDARAAHEDRRRRLQQRAARRASRSPWRSARLVEAPAAGRGPRRPPHRRASSTADARRVRRVAGASRRPWVAGCDFPFGLPRPFLLAQGWGVQADPAAPQPDLGRHHPARRGPEPARTGGDGAGPGRGPAGGRQVRPSRDRRAFGRQPVDEVGQSAGGADAACRRAAAAGGRGDHPRPVRRRSVADRPRGLPGDAGAPGGRSPVLQDRRSAQGRRSPARRARGHRRGASNRAGWACGWPSRRGCASRASRTRPRTRSMPSSARCRRPGPGGGATATSACRPTWIRWKAGRRAPSRSATFHPPRPRRRSRAGPTPARAQARARAVFGPFMRTGDRY